MTKSACLGPRLASGQLANTASRSMDLSLLIECDDEYWFDEDGNAVFRQPPGKPSKVACINCYIRLAQILAFAGRTIVSCLNHSIRT